VGRADGNDFHIAFQELVVVGEAMRDVELLAEFIQRFRDDIASDIQLNSIHALQRLGVRSANPSHSNNTPL
jgi:hypothetical protein